MEFSDKLDFLLNITQTSNKELAIAISVDRSLISLLRTGKRGMPRNHAHIQNMALFFAKHTTADFQRQALAEMSGHNIFRTPLPVANTAHYLTRWLTDELNILDEIIEDLDPIPQEINSTDKLPLLPIQGTTTTYFYNNEGRRASMRHMIDLLNTMETPCPILVASDDNLEWMLEDYSFLKRNTGKLD